MDLTGFEPVTFRIFDYLIKLFLKVYLQSGRATVAPQAHAFYLCRKKIIKVIVKARENEVRCQFRIDLNSFLCKIWLQTEVDIMPGKKPDPKSKKKEEEEEDEEDEEFDDEDEEEDFDEEEEFDDEEE